MSARSRPRKTVSARILGTLDRCWPVTFETGFHCRWMYDEIGAMGSKVLVTNPAKLKQFAVAGATPIGVEIGGLDGARIGSGSKSVNFSKFTLDGLGVEMIYYHTF